MPAMPSPQPRSRTFRPGFGTHWEPSTNGDVLVFSVCFLVIFWDFHGIFWDLSDKLTVCYGKIPIALIAKSTRNMAVFNSYVAMLNYQWVSPIF
jgi:hypothetical protein